MGRINICETYVKNERALYLAIGGRERVKEALNQTVFFNLSILVICKPPIWHDSRFLVCYYAEYKLYCSKFDEFQKE